MNDFVPDELVTILRGLYQSNETAKGLFDSFSNRKNKANFTTAEAVETATGAFRGDAVDLLKKLADLGLGTYFIGRRGAPTRIEWDYDVREIGKAAQGEIKTLTLIEPEDDPLAGIEVPSMGDAKAVVIDHTYQLRAEFRLRLSLPADLTEREADRIGAWVRSLPFGG